MLEQFDLTDTWVQDSQITLRKGNCLVVYSDTGPLGPCGQSMSITCPHTYLYWFPDEDTMRRKVSAGTIGRKGSRPRIEYAVVGDHGTGQMQLFVYSDEPEVKSEERCSECGYTEQDARTEMDHKLCKNYGKAPWSDAIGEIPS